MGSQRLRSSSPFLFPHFYFLFAVSLSGIALKNQVKMLSLSPLLFRRITIRLIDRQLDIFVFCSCMYCTPSTFQLRVRFIISIRCAICTSIDRTQRLHGRPPSRSGCTFYPYLAMVKSKSKSLRFESLRNHVFVRIIGVSYYSEKRKCVLHSLIEPSSVPCFGTATITQPCS